MPVFTAEAEIGAISAGVRYGIWSLCPPVSSRVTRLTDGLIQVDAAGGTPGAACQESGRRTRIRRRQSGRGCGFGADQVIGEAREARLNGLLTSSPGG